MCLCLCSRPFRALMWRNMIYRRRNWIGTALEVLTPIVFLGILNAIKSSVSGTSGFENEVVPAYFPNNTDAFVPFTFADYVTALQAKRQCHLQDINITDEEGNVVGAYQEFWITGIQEKGTNWQVPLVRCDSRKCEIPGEDAQPFCAYKIIAVAPSTVGDTGGLERATAFQKWIFSEYPALNDTSKMPRNNFEYVKLFASSEAIDDYVKHPDYGFSADRPWIAMGIVWQGNDANDWHYELRQNSTNFNTPETVAQPAVLTTPDTGTFTATYAKKDDACVALDGAPDQGPYTDSCTGQYMYNGLLTFQRLANDFILDQTGAADAGYNVARSGVRFVPFPQNEYTESGFFSAVSGVAPLLVVLGLLYPVAEMIRYMSREKELRQKELMKIMSVSEFDINFSWFCTFFGLHFITAFCLALLSSDLYSNSDFGYLWMFWLFGLTSVIVFSMAMASFNSKATRGILIGLLLTFVGYFLADSQDYRYRSSGLVGFLSLHPLAALSFGIQQIGDLEDKGIGLTSSSAGTTDYPSGYTFSNTLRFFIVDILLWGFVTWYLNRVIAPDYGQALPWYFPFTASYWCPSSRHSPTGESGENRGNYEGSVGGPFSAGVPVEPVSDALKQQAADGQNVEICNLRKEFGEKYAVDGLNLSLYRGQITALLGHNGAGKTTTISMLTGAVAPTDGYATIAGKDIRTQMNEIRQDFGICLQHDCLFPTLTVREHVKFFSLVKGLYQQVSKEEAEQHVDQAIQDVALFEKRNTLSQNLSGGMKRKLSVAIAFCGGSKIVILDEPTSGMDPFSRRFTWNVIRQYRQDRCIILTTHFMDEADILGDRIAIMAEGRLRCCGSSLFLKKTYGVGYQLTIEKKAPKDSQHGNKAEEETSMIQSSEDGHEVNNAAKGPQATGLQTNDEKFKQIVLRSVKEAALLSNVGTELSFQLPMGASSQFAPMFEQLDEEVDRGTISSYGVSITTLDEVFLLVARGQSTEKTEHFASSMHLDGFSSSQMANDAEKSARSRMDLTKDGLFVTHVGALFRKRAANFRRDKKAWCCTSIVPSVFVFLGLIIFKFSPSRDLDPIILSLDKYNAGLTAVKQPIPFNQPGKDFLCQPGWCAYQVSNYSNPVSEERYYYCGAQANLSDSFCSIDDQSAQIVKTLESENDIEAVPLDVGAAASLPSDTVNNTSLALFNSSKLYAATQYGGIFFTHFNSSKISASSNVTNTSYYAAAVAKCQNDPGMYASSSDCNLFRGVGYIIPYNFTAIHVAPIYQALADEALARHALNNDKINIKVTIAPLPLTKFEQKQAASQDASIAWFLVVLSFPFISGAFGTFIVSERQSKAKHLQTVAGVEPSAYWISTFLWDVMNYQIPCWITVILIFAFGVDVFTTSNREVVSGVIALLVLFGPAAASFTYCISYAFSSPSMINLFTIMLGFLVGVGGALTQFILNLIANIADPPRQNLIDAAKTVNWILRFVPSFCLAKGLLNAINIETYEYFEGEPITAWSEPILLYEVIFLAWETVAYLALAVLLDRWSTNPRAVTMWRKFLSVITCRCLCSGAQQAVDITVALPDDDDVIAEQDRVLAGGANDDLIVLSQLTKVYDNGKKAVNNVSLGIPPGECFGLLGINGAGKTTTMGMLTAEFPPSSGDATLAGFSVTNEPEKTRRRIGYCPQFDAHFANMTGREHVELYASIKGVPKQFIKEAAAAKLKQVGLSDKDADRLSSGYSGGMKRRLSLACAMVGQPQIVFLDECSTGVDPVARREIWQLISDMVTGENVPQNEKTSVILTTHSMEECEALCPRIGIMANGRLRCLGSAQHLKNKFGQGFQVELKIKLVDKADEDYKANAAALAATKNPTVDVEVGEDIFFNLEEALHALNQLTGDDFLSSMVNAENPVGYNVFKNASAGVENLEELAAFATGELRMRKLETFVKETYADSLLRERQDTKVRYEVSSKNIRISGIFASIEENKDALMLSDYGVSQTSLEQVFNMHAAEAEKLKQGRNDG